MAAAGVLVAGFVAVGLDAFLSVTVPLALAALAAFLFTGAGNALNDYLDRESDRVNHPARPIPSGRIRPEGARLLAAALFVASVLAAVFVNALALAILLVNVVVMVTYEIRFKARGGPGNAMIAYLVGSLFLFGGAAVFEGPTDQLVRTLSLAVLAALSTAGREVVKDIEDLAGDVARTTLPRRRGVRSAAIAAAAAWILAVALSFVPYALGTLGLAYLPVVILADATFIYAALHSARDPGRSQRASKVAMVIALVAFVAGGFP